MVDEVAFLRWIPLLPLASALALAFAVGVLRRPPSRAATVALGCGSVAIAFGLCVHGFARLIALESRPGSPRMLLDVSASWMGVGVGKAAFSADLAFQFDALSAVMALLVTGVGLLIHLYAVGYMQNDERDDRGFQRFFAYMNLFVCAMLVLVLGDNLLMLFLGWEGVGLCSYLLIGFWYSDAANARAGSKAFIVNRIGDFGFLIGILLLFWSLSGAGAPSVAFREIQASFGLIADTRVALPAWLAGAFGSGVVDLGLPSLIALCFFVGACGKSAQFPLHVWLPDAMAGPTPVSALIHAATMVTAGVYMMCRLSFLFAAAPEAGAVIAWVGGLTAFFAATVAIAQSDIKKVLAWSTISQLGFMFLAAGCGAYSVALFHVVTHAFFKAALFLGAGSVILACGHEQDIRKMGGLHARLPRTHLSMLCAVATLAGMPPLAAFFSKDEILLATHLAEGIPGHVALYRLALLTAGLTSFYAFRMYFMVFWGQTRLDLVRRGRVREPSPWMLQPLGVLAALAVFGGAFGLPQFWGDVLGIDGSDSLGRFVGEVVVAAPAHAIDRGVEGELILYSVLVFLLGLGAALQLYAFRDPEAKEAWTRFLGAPYRALVHRYWIDELYDRAIVRPLLLISDRVLYRAIDVAVIDRAGVHGVAQTVRGLADGVLRFFHAGWTQSYLMTMTVGLGLLLIALFAS